MILQAYESLGNGLGKSAAVLVQNPLKKYQRGSGAGPALAAAVRAVPAAAIAPASACASAVHYTLLGIRNRSTFKTIIVFLISSLVTLKFSGIDVPIGFFFCSLDPVRKKESMEKYCPTQPWEED